MTIDERVLLKLGLNSYEQNKVSLFTKHAIVWSIHSNSVKQCRSFEHDSNHTLCGIKHLKLSEIVTTISVILLGCQTTFTTIKSP